jgi:hypothetical protein
MEKVATGLVEPEPRLAEAMVTFASDVDMVEFRMGRVAEGTVEETGVATDWMVMSRLLVSVIRVLMLAMLIEPDMMILVGRVAEVEMGVSVAPEPDLTVVVSIG